MPTEIKTNPHLLEKYLYKEYPSQLQTPNRQWIILVNRFDNRASAVRLKQYFPSWKMKVYEAENGEYWLNCLNPQPGEGQEMVKNWKKEAGYSSTNLEMRIMEVNAPAPKTIGG